MLMTWLAFCLVVYAEARILLYYQLLFQVPRAPRHRFPRPEEETAWFVPFFFFFFSLNFHVDLEMSRRIICPCPDRPTAFLHVYHHAVTAFLCYTQLNGRTSIVRLRCFHF